MAERAAYEGRGETARFVWRTLALKCEAPESPDNENGGWRWTASTLKWLKALCTAAWREGGDNTPKLAAEEAKRAQQIQRSTRSLLKSRTRARKEWAQCAGEFSGCL